MILLSSAACQAPADDDGTAPSAITRADTFGTAAAEACTATFHWLQKDAYSNYSGRRRDLWPPHTTTTLEVRCGDEAPVVAFRENHGTKPDAKDEWGTHMLTEVSHNGPISTTRERANELLTAYRGCECEPSTFLSLESVNQQRAIDLAKALANYVQSNMTCDGIDVSDLANLFTEGYIENVLANLSTCRWNDGKSWAEGFQLASDTELPGDVGTYHVCNNDAKLQSELFTSFTSDKKIEACNANSPLCQRPTWFYAP